MSSDKIKLMVSSTVYGQEDLLDQVFAILDGFGFEVWMSAKGTLPQALGHSNLAKCLRAVDSCDLFFGIITGRYGSVVDGSDKSITHHEMMRAVDVDKPRLFAVHRDVVTAHQLLAQFRFDDSGTHTRFTIEETPVLEDIRVLDQYDYILQEHIEPSLRKDHWAHQYTSAVDLFPYLDTQFRDPERLRSSLTRGLR